MAITPPPTPPNTGNPAQLEERADAFFGWFPTFVADYNADLPLLRGKTYATRGGTANAITLNTGGVALATGMQVRWRAAAANTGPVTINVDGQGAIEARTITNVALPAGYIRTDADTVATYDGTRWIVSRAIERGANANGEFMRFEDGTLQCWRVTGAEVGPVNTAAPSGGFISAPVAFTYPAVFSQRPVVSPSAFRSVDDPNIVLGGAAAVSLTGFTGYLWAAASLSLIAFRLDYSAVGRWY